jgi:hypothetical protein
MKTLLMIGGEKGGTGKSSLSMLITDYLIRQNANFVLVEGDTGTPDVRNRYAGYVPGIGIPLNRAGIAEQAITDFLSKIEDIDADIAIVNLPANSSETIDGMAKDLIQPVTEELGIDVRFVFALGAGAETIDNARASLESGLASISSKLALVYNEKIAAPEAFAFARPEADEVREHWAATGATQHALPLLLESVMDQVRGIPGPLSAIADDKSGPLKTVQRQVLRKWIASADEIAKAVLSD